MNQKFNRTYNHNARVETDAAANSLERKSLKKPHVVRSEHRKDEESQLDLMLNFKGVIMKKSKERQCMPKATFQTPHPKKEIETEMQSAKTPIGHNELSIPNNGKMSLWQRSRTKKFTTEKNSTEQAALL